MTHTMLDARFNKILETLGDPFVLDGDLDDCDCVLPEHSCPVCRGLGDVELDDELPF